MNYVVNSVNQWVSLLGGANRVVVGLGISSAANYMSAAEAATTIQLVKGNHPNIRGAFVWQIHSDETQGWPFANVVAPILNP